MKTKEKAQSGLEQIKEAILETLEANKGGLTNAKIAEELGLRSDYRGKHKGFLSWSVLGLLLNDGSVRKDGKNYYLG